VLLTRVGVTLKANPEPHDGNRLLQVAEGLQILAKYSGTFELSVGHDTIYAGSDPDLDDCWDEDDDDPSTPRDNRLSEEDQERLEELGWFICSETVSWAFYT
jgi:hypothetical protein